MMAMIDQLLTVTPEAREKIDGVRTFNDFPDAVLRVRVVAKEGPRFRYEIALEDPRDRERRRPRHRRSMGSTVVRRPARAPPTWPAPRSISIRPSPAAACGSTTRTRAGRTRWRAPSRTSSTGRSTRASAAMAAW